MFTPNDTLLYLLAREIMRDRLHEADTYRLAKMSRRNYPGWLSRSACRILSRLGNLLLAWGMQLLDYSFTTGQLPEEGDEARKGILISNCS
jgi:hypothetical protein